MTTRHRAALAVVLAFVAAVAAGCVAVAWGQGQGQGQGPLDVLDDAGMGWAAGAVATLIAVGLVVQKLAAAGLFKPLLTWLLGKRTDATDATLLAAIERRITPLEETVRRSRLALGLAIAPDEPPPSVGLIADVAALVARVVAIETAQGEIRKQLREAIQGIDDARDLVAEAVGDRTGLREQIAAESAATRQAITDALTEAKRGGG